MDRKALVKSTDPWDELILPSKSVPQSEGIRSFSKTKPRIALPSPYVSKFPMVVSSLPQKVAVLLVALVTSFSLAAIAHEMVPGLPKPISSVASVYESLGGTFFNSLLRLSD